MDELDKKLIYCYRNDFPQKKMCEMTGTKINTIKDRLKKLKKQGVLKKWWEEQGEI